MKKLALVLLVGCASSTPRDVGLLGLGLTDVEPGTAVPGTTIAITGDSFVDADWGTSRLHLSGGGIDLVLPAEFVDFTHLAAHVTSADLDQLGGDTDFVGAATVEVESAEDGRTYASDPLSVTIAFRRQLTPAATTVQTGGVIFVNDAIEVDGSGFLLGGDEGTTVAIVDGCFAIDPGPCNPVATVEVPLVPAEPFSRERATFAFLPDIAGIEAGHFDGQVRLENRPPGAATTASASRSVSYDLVTSQIFRINPAAASLGQYVTIEGGGFVGEGGATVIRLQGTFTLTGTSTPAPVDLELIPAFVDGRTVRYVMNEDDALGRAIDLRQDTGTFTGTATPVIDWANDEVIGEATSVTLAVAPVKQVVFLDYTPSYVESLRMYGLRAAERLLRARIQEVVAGAYPGINIEFRDAAPDDFALYSHVELYGPDPNGQGLFGYDNTPGKDTGNQRLYDQLGGVNASTQEDGFPGYGGVFVDSFMGYSSHPAVGDALPDSDGDFDALFDDVRPDGGHIVDGEDLAAGIPTVTGMDCPASDRPHQIACAIHVLGSLIGSTLSHEIGHSLGLANPYGEGYHDPGDQADRLMDAGGDRPFAERAEILGSGPAVFCDEEYSYLRTILPSTAAADPSARPGCN